jgi:putative lipoic acid-binding regulatory protein
LANNSIPPDPKALLEYPTLYPIKVVGRQNADLRARIDAVVLRHVADLDHSLTSVRPSSAGNFTAISYTIRAQSAAQVAALVSELNAQPDVVMVI